MQDFRKLRVWQAANQLTADIYAVTRGFPAEERFGLTAQLRSAAATSATYRRMNSRDWDDAVSDVRKMLIRLLLRLKSKIKYSPTWR